MRILVLVGLLALTGCGEPNPRAAAMFAAMGNRPPLYLPQQPMYQPSGPMFVTGPGNRTVTCFPMGNIISCN